MAQWISPTLGGLVVLRSGLENLIDNVYATITGGSGKWFDDFPIIGLPAGDKQRGIGAAAARSNLDGGLPAGGQNTSAENDATAGDHTASNGTISVIATDQYHGAKCFQLLATGNAPSFNTDLTAVTAAGTLYTTHRMVKAPAGRTIRISLIGDTSGATNADFTATGIWQFVKVSKTFAAGDTTSRTRTCSLTDGVADDVFLHDCLMTNANGTPLLFVEKEALLSKCYVPQAKLFSPGQSVSMVFLFSANWLGNEGVYHFLFQNTSLLENWANAFCVFYSNGCLYLTVADAAANWKRTYGVVSTLWANPGLRMVACSVDADNNQLLCADGTKMTTVSGTNGRESAHQTNTYLGCQGSYNTRLIDGSMLAFILPGYAFTAEECVAYSSLKGRYGFRRWTTD